MSKALYRKYRSKTLKEIVGQDHVTDILERSLARGHIAHAYLLTGPRGIGKTSIARILAHEINNLPYNDESTHLDIIEIDAASNNGVEDVRELRNKVQIAPVSASKKIYIIDEVHMLSKAAFNALLKTLEEPPEHAVFILATTDADKLPATIISRTQQFRLRAIAPVDAVKHLRTIAKQENIAISDDALELIALRGEGSFRDSISLFDQLQNLGVEGDEISRELIEQSLGIAPNEQIINLLAAYEAKDLVAIVTQLGESEKQGIQPGILTQQLIQLVRGQIVKKPQLIELLDHLLEISKSSRPDIKLLTTLAAHAAPQKPKTAALVAPTPTVSATIPELERQALKPNPVEKRMRPKETVSKSAAPSEPQEPRVAVPPAPEKFEWTALIEHTRQNYVAIYSVLSKCAYEIDGTTLILYTGNSFYKRKLDDAKYRGNLAKSLVATGVGDMDIETIASPPPPKDSTAAAVAAIMGGGEEVSVGDEAPAKSGDGS